MEQKVRQKRRCWGLGKRGLRRKASGGIQEVLQVRRVGRKMRWKGRTCTRGKREKEDGRSAEVSTDNEKL